MACPQVGDTGSLLGGLHLRLRGGDALLGLSARRLRQVLGPIGLLLGVDDAVAGLPQRPSDASILLAVAHLDPVPMTSDGVRQVEQSLPALRCGCSPGERRPRIRRWDNAKVQIGSPARRRDRA